MMVMHCEKQEKRVGVCAGEIETMRWEQLREEVGEAGKQACQWEQRKAESSDGSALTLGEMKAAHAEMQGTYKVLCWLTSLSWRSLTGSFETE